MLKDFLFHWEQCKMSVITEHWLFHLHFKSPLRRLYPQMGGWIGSWVPADGPGNPAGWSRHHRERHMDTGRLRVTFHKRHRCLVQTCHSMMPSVALQGCLVVVWGGWGGWEINSCGVLSSNPERHYAQLCIFNVYTGNNKIKKKMFTCKLHYINNTWNNGYCPHNITNVSLPVFLLFKQL